MLRDSNRFKASATAGTDVQNSEIIRSALPRH